MKCLKSLYDIRAWQKQKSLNDKLKGIQGNTT